MLRAKGLDLSQSWQGDTLLMAATLTEKIPEDWLAAYNAQRDELNKQAPRGHRAQHRAGSPHSLKCLAPYFTGCAPFWETANHASKQYVLDDCRHTLALYHELKGRLEAEGGFEFYQERLLPYTRMLLEAECRGISLDMPALEEAEVDAKQKAAIARAQLELLWAAPIKWWEERQAEILSEHYSALVEKALVKAKNPAATRARYAKLEAAARTKLPRFNIDSPAQLMWLLRDYYQLGVTDFNGDETTGKATLQRLASEGREDIATFLTYRKNQKLSSAFFPSYKEMQHNGNLHCSFNPTGTRTGRLSSSGPNLQQVPGHLHRLFRARPGYKLATYDMSAVEPRVIAYYTGDKALFDIIATGQDFHGYNTRIFFDLQCEVGEVKDQFPRERKLGKEVGLALFYGAGAGRIQESAQRHGFQWGRGECERKLDAFKRAYPGVYEFRRTLEQALREGPVANLLGRQFRLSRDDFHMKGLNTLVQSSASDLVLNSAHRIMKTFHERAIDGHVLLLVHDELVVEVPAEREAECVQIITSAMTAYTLNTAHGRVPLAVEGKVADVWTK